MALLVGAGFYVLAIGAVSYIAPWQGLLGKRFATAIAFEQATHSALLVRVILGISLVALFQVYNGNFVASTRLLFAFGRRGTVPRVFAKTHAANLTPWVAIVAVGGRNAGGAAAGGFAAGAGDGSGGDGVCAGMVCGLHFVFSGGDARGIASDCGSGNDSGGFAGADETGAAGAGTFQRRGVDCAGRMAGDWFAAAPACRESELKGVVYTFEGAKNGSQSE